MVKSVCYLLLFVGGLFVTACSQEVSTFDDRAVSYPTIVVKQKTSSVKKESLLRDEIAATLEGFYEAFYNGEVGKLFTYLSESCNEEDIDVIGGSSLLVSLLIGGRVDLEVDASGLNLQRNRRDRVSVLRRTDGGSSVTIKIDGRPLPDDYRATQGGLDRLDLVLEDGVWRVENCDDFADEVEYDPEEFDAEGYR